MNHGDAPAALPEPDDPDPELFLVGADPVLWDLAHPCECPALCTCDHSQ